MHSARLTVRRSILVSFYVTYFLLHLIQNVMLYVKTCLKNNLCASDGNK